MLFRSIFWGRNDRLAPVPAYVTQWNNQPYVGGILQEISGDTRGSPVATRWLAAAHSVRGDKPQNIVCGGFETVDLCNPPGSDTVMSV